MTFPGSFTEHLIAGHLDQVSPSFLADDLRIRRGGWLPTSATRWALGLSPLLSAGRSEEHAEDDAERPQPAAESGWGVHRGCLHLQFGTGEQGCSRSDHCCTSLRV